MTPEGKVFEQQQGVFAPHLKVLNTLFRFYTAIILDYATPGEIIHCSNDEQRLTRVEKHYDNMPTNIKKKLPDIKHLVNPTKITFQKCCSLIDQSTAFDGYFVE